MTPGLLAHRLRYFVTDAWEECRDSPGVNVLATATMAAVLLVTGLLALVLSNAELRVRALQAEVPLQVYLRDGVTAEARESVRSEIEGASGVLRVSFVSAEEALRRYREWAADRAELIDELPANPLPASFEVQLAPGADSRRTAEALTARLSERPEVEQVGFDVDWLAQLEGLLAGGRKLGLGLAGVTFAVLVLVVGAVLRLAVHARREEIEIMLLVGASPNLVRGPFLVAGLAQGLAAATVALALVELLRQLVAQRGASAMPVLVDLLASRPLEPAAAGTILALGGALGLAGAWIAVWPETRRKVAAGS